MNAETGSYGQHHEIKKRIAVCLEHRGELVDAQSLRLVRMKPLEYAYVEQLQSGVRIGILNCQHPNANVHQFVQGENQYGVCLLSTGRYAAGIEPQVDDSKSIIALRLEGVHLNIPITFTPTADSLGLHRVILGGYDTARQFLQQKYDTVLETPIDTLPYYIRQFTVVDRFALKNDS